MSLLSARFGRCACVLRSVRDDNRAFFMKLKLYNGSVIGHLRQFELFEKTIAFTIFVFITAENVFANNQKNNFKGNKLKGN